MKGICILLSVLMILTCALGLASCAKQGKLPTPNVPKADSQTSGNTTDSDKATSGTIDSTTGSDESTATDEASTTNDGTTSEDGTTSGEGETTSGEGETTSGEGETTSGEGETTSGEGETTSGESNDAQTPESSKETTDTEDNTPETEDPYTPAEIDTSFVIPNKPKAANRYAILGGTSVDFSAAWAKALSFAGKTKSTAKGVVITTAGRDTVSNTSSYVNNMKEYINNVTNITLSTKAYSTEELYNICMSADIIWVGGGQSEYMGAAWKQFRLDEVLRAAYNAGKVCMGGSAGCMCWTYCSWNDNYVFHEDSSLNNKTYTWYYGIDVIPIYVGPHFSSTNDNKQWQNFPQELKKITNPKYKIAYAIDNDAAIVFKNETAIGGLRKNSTSRVFEYKFSSGSWNSGTQWANSKFE